MSAKLFLAHSVFEKSNTMEIFVFSPIQISVKLSAESFVEKMVKDFVMLKIENSAVNSRILSTIFDL